MNLTGIVVRVPVVVLAALVALGVALGLGAGTARAASDEQAWGLVDTPAAVDAGWQGPLVVSWRNFSGEARTYRVTLTGPGTDQVTDLAVDAEENTFTREVAVPALTTAGAYRAELTLVGSDEVLSFANVRVAQPRIVGMKASTRSLATTGRSAQRRTVATFGVDSTAGVSARVVDARGRTVVRRSLGAHRAGERLSWSWSAQDAAGRAVAPGTYRLQLVARAGDTTSTRSVRLTVVR